MSFTPAGSQLSEVNPAQLATFTRQLGAMLQAGVDVLRALRIASQYSGSHQLSQASEEIGRLLAEGRELHQALSRYPHLFGSFYVEMARQGEADGTLGETLLAVADYLDRVADSPLPAEEAPAVLPRGTQVVPATPLVSASGVLDRIFNSLGAALLGAGVLVALSAMAPTAIPLRWTVPLALLWSGACLLYGARGTKQPSPPAEQSQPSLQGQPVAVGKPAPPKKSAERKAAETEGVVRSALEEQQEQDERPPLDRVDPFAPVNPFEDPGTLIPDELPRAR